MSEHSPEKPDTSISYGVQYRTVDAPDGDWREMSGRNWNEPFQHPAAAGSTYETTSLDEAVEIAEALVSRISHPQDPKSRHYRRVTGSRVIVRVYTGHVAAVYTARD